MPQPPKQGRTEDRPPMPAICQQLEDATEEIRLRDDTCPAAERSIAILCHE
jgi:hypothetical protein